MKKTIIKFNIRKSLVFINPSRRKKVIKISNRSYLESMLENVCIIWGGNLIKQARNVSIFWDDNIVLYASKSNNLIVWSRNDIWCKWFY